MLYQKRQAWLDLIEKHEELYSPLEEIQAEMVLEALNLSLTEAKIITIEES